MNDYMKFKKILAWFVNQLNVNNNIIEGEKVTGRGYNNNSSLRKYYADCRSYTYFDLDCTINHQYGNYATTSNYINLANTSFNIIPVFDDGSKAVTSLYIGNHLPKKAIEHKSDTVPVDSLGLNDTEPNQALCNFFDIFNFKISEYKRNLTTDDEREQRTAFRQWYVNNVGTANSASTISTAIGKSRLKNGRAVFSILDFDELNDVIVTEGMDGYFEARGSDYSKMNTVFNIEANTQMDDLKNGIKFYLRFLKIRDSIDLIDEENNTDSSFLPNEIVLYHLGGLKETHNLLKRAKLYELRIRVQ